MARCRVLHGNVDTPTNTKELEGGSVLGHAPTSGAVEHGNGPEELEMEGLSPGLKVVTVLFSLRCARFVGLVIGGHVRIHPPW